MTNRWQPFLYFCVAMLLVAACNPGSSAERPLDEPLSGRILLWHTWTGAEGRILDGMLAGYRQLNPGVEIISVGVDEGTFVSRFADSGAAGLGPDLVLADAGMIYDLAEQGLIRDLAPLELDLSTYLSTAVRMVSDETHLYALPFSGHTEVLFYNKELVQTPPATIAELLQRVAAGEVFAQNTNFRESYWGVGAYDGDLLDEERRPILGMGGFENWLDFLANARTVPGFLLDHDPAVLQQAFIDEEAAYYVADSAQLPSLVAAMGADKVGVALLPTGPNGGIPRPFLSLDAFAFSKVSSDADFALALDLAQFLGDAQTQLALAADDLGHVPVNNQVRLAPSLPENTLTVARQSRSAAPIRFVNQQLWKDLQAGALGFFDNYRRVTQGTLSPGNMVEQAIEDFSQEYGSRLRVVQPEELCPAQPGSMTVWHALRGDEARVFEELARDFEVACPGVAIEIAYVPDEQIATQFAEQAQAGEGPDMLHASSRWLAPLAEAGLLLDLTERVSASFLQQFVPNTVEAMRYDGSLYGIPESVTILALFYNNAVVVDPPIDVQQWLQNASPDSRLALPMGFFWGYWGLRPFGGFTFDSYTGEILDTTGLVAWLETLQQAAPIPGVDLYFDPSAAEDAFAYEEAAYLVSGPWSLNRLRQEVGPDRFRVVPLPNGPVGPGSPMLRVQGTMIHANASPLAVDVALAFSKFLNLPQSQQRFLETGNHVTASVTVDLTGHPNIDSFHQEAKVAALVVENSNFATMESLGDQLYRSVLEDGAVPAEAVAAFVEAVHGATGVQ